MGSLCRRCAEREHPGEIFYLGRWRTLDECFKRISGDRVMRGVVWAREGDLWVGRAGNFEMRLRADIT